MAKNSTIQTQAEWEGGEAARSGRGRSTNPYPQSDIVGRNEWFAGYDLELLKLTKKSRFAIH